MKSENSYSVGFSCVDPDSQYPVRYVLTVKVPPQLVVHPADMVIEVNRMAVKERRHHELADALRTRFPGKLTLTADLFGVKVKLTREGTA
jgi:hypothetical protein